MNNLAAVIVQIIGLAVLRNESQMGGMHVILPTVAPTSEVEGHTPILAFKTKDLVANGSTWQFHQLTPAPGYSYVTLYKERVSFVVKGTNPRATVPKKLPHLTTNCTAMNLLAQPYQPPAYTGAAAVVLIPYGDARACVAQKQEVSGRIDTQVRINTSGTFQAISRNKTITLKGNATVVIANVPTAWLLGAESSHKSHTPHFRAYYAMQSLATTGTAGSSTCKLVPPSKISRCPSVAFAIPTGQNPDPPLDKVVPQTTFECSNTQWP